MKEIIASITKNFAEWKENSSRKKTAEELLLREYHPTIQKELMLHTAYGYEAGAHKVVFNDSNRNKNTIIQWTANAFKIVLNIQTYEQLNETEKSDLSYLVRSMLQYSDTSGMYGTPFPVILTCSEVSIFESAFYSGDKVRITTHENKIKINPAFNLNDQAAVDALTVELGSVIKNRFPRCYVNRAQLVMLMQKQQGSIFSQLPRDVARIIGEYAEPRVKRCK